MSCKTQLERFRLTVAHEPHDEFLYHADFTPDLRARILAYTGLQDVGALAEQFGMYQQVDVHLKPPAGFEAPDFSRFFSDIEIPEGGRINGIGVLEVNHGFYHFTRYISPLRNATTLDEIKQYPFATCDGWSDHGMAAEVERIHDRGRVAVSWIGHMYENAWQIRGYEEFLMDMLTVPKNCEYILDRLCEVNLGNAVAAARAGVDVVTTGDDVANQKAMMFDPEVWWKFIGSRWAKVYAAAREIKPDIQIWYHSDGNIADIVPKLIDIGVTILNPVQPECLDLAKMKWEYGKHLVFDGTVGTQTTMPFGTPDEVRRVVSERKETLGKDGALILSPTHVLEPEVPIENVLAFLEAAGGRASGF